MLNPCEWMTKIRVWFVSFRGVQFGAARGALQRWGCLVTKPSLRPGRVANDSTSHAPSKWKVDAGSVPPYLPYTVPAHLLHSVCTHISLSAAQAKRREKLRLTNIITHFQPELKACIYLRLPSPILRLISGAIVRLELHPSCPHPLVLLPYS